MITSNTKELSQRTIAIITGAALLIMAVAAIYATSLLDQLSNSQQTAQLNSSGYFYAAVFYAG